jgi:hypothetical protein
MERESSTEVELVTVPTKINRLRTELVSFALFLFGLVQVIDPDVLAMALGNTPQVKGWVIISFAVVLYILRRITATPPEPIVRPKPPRVRKAPQVDAD